MLAALRYALWPAYWWLQGVVCTGLWVIAHECGHQVHPPLVPTSTHSPVLAARCSYAGSRSQHDAWPQAFSKYQAVNDGVGLVVHSCLLVPYYSWWAVNLLVMSANIPLPQTTCDLQLLTTLCNSMQEALAQAPSQQHRQCHEG